MINASNRQSFLGGEFVEKREREEIDRYYYHGVGDAKHCHKLCWYIHDSSGTGGVLKRVFNKAGEFEIQVQV